MYKTNNFITICFLFFIVSCGSSSSGGSGTEGDSGGGGDTGNGGSLQATLSSIQDNIFTPSCALGGCHNSTAASAGLVLEDGQSFSNLVNVMSTQATSLNRVEPNDSGNSYLIDKLLGTQNDVGGTGARMPRIGSLLTDAQIDIIMDWIDNGALDN